MVKSRCQEPNTRESQLVPKVQKKHIKLMAIFVPVAGAIVLCLVLTFMAVIVVYRTETKSDVAKFSEKVPKATGYLDVSIKVNSVDLIQNTMTLQTQVLPKGDLVDAKRELKQDVTISWLAFGLRETQTINAGETGDYFSSQVDLNGTVSDYPWDKHTADSTISFEQPGPGGQSKGLPARMQFFGSLPGFNLNARAAMSEGGAVQKVDMWVARSSITKVVVVFSIALIWVLIATVVSMVVSVSVRGHQLQLAMFAFFGTLLFAMTAFRNALPGTPPMGVLSDYLAFFWGYTVAIIAIGVLTVTYLVRLPKKGEQKKD
jgi:hypothetical protein